MSGDPGGEARSPAGEGMLAVTDLLELFVDVAREAATGVLRCVREEHVVEVCFLEGKIADVLSNAEGTSLSACLVREGKVIPEQIRVAEETRREEEDLGGRLVRLGYIAADELAWMRRRRVDLILSDLLGWGEGTWRWYAGPPERPVDNLALPPLQVVVGTLMQHTDPEVALADLGGEEARWSLPTERLGALGAFEVPEPFDLLATRLDGRRVEEIVGEGVVPPEAAVRYLGTLHRLNLLDAVQPAGRAPSGSERGAMPEPPDPASAPATAPDAEGPAAPDPPPAPAERQPAPDPSGGAIRPRPAGEEGEERRETLVEEVMSHGTLVEVLFSLALLAAVFVGVLYMGRHYLAGLREEIDETRVTRAAQTPVGDREELLLALPPGSARRMLSEAEFRLLSEEPEREEIALDPGARRLVREEGWRRARDQFELGNYGRAGESWRAFLAKRPGDEVVLRMSRACAPEEIRTGAEAAGEGILLLPEEEGECFLVLRGLFRDLDEARRVAAEAALEGEPVTLADLLGSGQR